MDAAAINQRVTELRRELFDLRLQKNTTNLEKSHLLTEHKRDIARLLTVLNSKESK
ncbi:MAG: 50S ribosomal protein L29 [Halobacteriovoraceae bacterium]|nr:50S ribosomal protein L29 [Halobacteriovoraceae bacterium]